MGGVSGRSRGAGGFLRGRTVLGMFNPIRERVRVLLDAARVVRFGHEDTCWHGGVGGSWHRVGGVRGFDA